MNTLRDRDCGYCHIDFNWMRYPNLVLVILLLYLAVMSLKFLEVAGLLAFGAGLLILSGCVSTFIKVEDAGDRLQIRSGPVSLFRRSIQYAEVTSVETGRIPLFLAFHWGSVPFLGRTYSFGQLDCVKMQLGRQVVRLGSSDAARLAEFVRSKMNKELKA